MRNKKLIPGLFVLQMLFLTGCPEPEKQMMVSTGTATNIQYTSADVSGTIVDMGGGITRYGHCYSQSMNPTLSDEKTELTNAKAGNYTSTLTGLSANKKYYVKAYASRGQEVVYGEEISFTTAGTITDIDANQYNVVQIGTQIWMKENLKTTKYNDGANITLIEDNATWISLNYGAYCWFDNVMFGYKNTYGGLYNWHAVNTGKLCPAGWHVPTFAEWGMLNDFLGGVAVAGGKLKESGFDHWESPNAGATNETGFTAIPYGWRESTYGNFVEDRSDLELWSATESAVSFANTYWLTSDNPYGVIAAQHKKYGLSVRCLKN